MPANGMFEQRLAVVPEQMDPSVDAAQRIAGAGVEGFARRSFADVVDLAKSRGEAWLADVLCARVVRPLGLCGCSPPGVQLHHTYVLQ